MEYQFSFDPFNLEVTSIIVVFSLVLLLLVRFKYGLFSIEMYRQLQKDEPNVGLEPTTVGLRVQRSTD